MPLTPRPAFSLVLGAAVAVFVVGLATPPALASEDVQTLLFDPADSARDDRTVPVKIYRVESDMPQPVVLFSHGLGGSREGNKYLGDHWARNGYVAVFMQHLGSDRTVWEGKDRSKRLELLKKAANLQSTLNRFNDVPFVIDILEEWNKEKGHALHGKLDLDHIGLAGHSYGAVTTTGLTGRKYAGYDSFRDERIDAFLPMSPQPGRGMPAEEAFADVHVPILCMTGTKDGSPINAGVTPAFRREVYAALPPGDKYQLVFLDGEHFAFGDSAANQSKRNPKHHPTILKISTQFWHAYLKGDAKAKAWLRSDAPRAATELVDGDVWEWK